MKSEETKDYQGLTFQIRMGKTGKGVMNFISLTCGVYHFCYWGFFVNIRLYNYDRERFYGGCFENFLDEIERLENEIYKLKNSKP